MQLIENLCIFYWNFRIPVLNVPDVVAVSWKPLWRPWVNFITQNVSFVQCVSEVWRAWNFLSLRIISQCAKSALEGMTFRSLNLKSIPLIRFWRWWYNQTFSALTKKWAALNSALISREWAALNSALTKFERHSRVELKSALKKFIQRVLSLLTFKSFIMIHFTH